MKKISLLVCVLLSMPLVAQTVPSVKLTQDRYTVQNNLTVSSSGSKVVCTLSWAQVSVIINTTGGVFTGSPTLTYTLSEVDPGDLTTAFTGAQTYTGAVISAAGTQVLTLTGQVSPCVKLSWVFTGTSITHVRSTLTTRTSVTDTVYNGMQSGTISAQCSDANIQSCGANSTLSIPMAGQFGASVSVPVASTLVTVLKPDCGYLQPDLTTTLWEPTLFDDPQTGDKTVSYTTVSGTINSLSIVGCHGASHLRVRASSSPTGSGVLVMGSSFMNDPSLLFTGGTGSSNQPPATAQMGAWTGSTLQPLSMDPTSKAVKFTPRPMEVLGCYEISTNTGTYGGLAAGAIMFSMRWTDATKIAVVQRFTISMAATVAASAAGPADRELMFARSFSASDTGGTAITLTGNNAKKRTSFATSVMGDMRVMSGGSALAAGTRTLDSNGMGIWGTTQTTAAITVSMNGQLLPKGDLFNVANGGAVEYPIILAQNEGLEMRMKTAEPTSATQITYIEVVWCELANSTSFP